MPSQVAWSSLSRWWGLWGQGVVTHANQHAISLATLSCHLWCLAAQVQIPTCQIWRALDSGRAMSPGQGREGVSMKNWEMGLWEQPVTSLTISPWLSHSLSPRGDPRAAKRSQCSRRGARAPQSPPGVLGRQYVLGPAGEEGISILPQAKPGLSNFPQEGRLG